ncbi:sigma-70 family RNA polymerase sigma factor [Marivibrio halodurans]|nr:sigma-70 family RNA polymerase sigma factor [Marivibrio halodurans]
MKTTGTGNAEQETERAAADRSEPVEPGPEEHAAWMRAVAQERSKVAFARLFDHFAPRIKAYLVRSGSDMGAAEELVQEAMLIVWRRAESFDRAQASVATWMFTIARNKRIDAYRRMSRPELDPDDPALAPQPEPMQDDSVGADETAQAIRTAIADLPEEQAEMLRLAFYEDLAHSEIAEKTGLPLGTVKSRLRLAIGKMRGLVDDDLR